MIMHAEWGGRGLIEGAAVLDVFAGTGSLGLEALSRGAASACLIESDPSALRALRANIAACKAESRTEVLASDALTVADSLMKKPAAIVFLDPPYGLSLVPRALARLREVGRLRAGTVVVAETARDEDWVPEEPLLAERRYGAARIVIVRAI
jgi:16S rRNA (guanine966-N2)-methyltransferase